MTLKVYSWFAWKWQAGPLTVQRYYYPTRSGKRWNVEWRGRQPTHAEGLHELGSQPDACPQCKGLQCAGHAGELFHEARVQDRTRELYRDEEPVTPEWVR